MRRHALALLLWLAAPALWAGQLPILFVHGNEESAALWETTIWRFESNGYDPALLAAIDFTHPKARDADHTAQANRSSTADQLAELTAAIERLLAATHQDQLVLVASSRGGFAVRNFIRHGGGAKVRLAILCGTPNHGVFALPFRLDLEFNGLGPFLRGLNHPQETDAGIRFVTLRSDHNDKYAQSWGGALGLPYVPTFVGTKGPALAGAENLVLPDKDHREVALSREAFALIWREVTGEAPRFPDPVAEAAPRLTGVISGFEHGAPTNLPLAGAGLDIYEIDPTSGERLGEPLWHQITGEDGRWGAFAARPDAYYEFVVSATGYPVTHFYRTPFPRSYAYEHMRLEPAPPSLGAGAVVTLSRPRGYLGKGRDTILIDGKTPDSLPDGVPIVAETTARFPAAPARSVAVQFNQERLIVRTFPLADGHRVVAEVHN
jgi:pimeloyl-ACP methyl ester carboxylesterase